LIGLSKTSYWLPIRLTRYRAHPPHSFIHLHVSIRPENSHLPQCIPIYQRIQIYDYSIQYPFARIQAVSLNKHVQLEYSLFNEDAKEKIFSIDKQTGFIHLLPTIVNSRRLKSDYFLTIDVTDHPQQLSTHCYMKVHLIRRRQLIPRFLHSSTYHIDLPTFEQQSSRLRQRLFQIIALLDNQVYNRKLEIRYRIIDVNQNFIINRQTGYVAVKQPLTVYTTYELTVRQMIFDRTIECCSQTMIYLVIQSILY
jgi:hypothetical protein